MMACMEDRDDRTIPNYGLPPKILFKVVDVELKAFPDTDEVFAEFVLLPDGEEGEKSAFRRVPRKIPASSFRKTLTASDACTHGGCGLPKTDVEKIFPPLDTSQNQASQYLMAKDLHGKIWKFQHVFRGEPKRHMLVHGWNRFVSAKKLIEGDTCIFMRGLGHNEIYIGIQREVRIQKIPRDLDGSAMRRGVLLDAAVSMDTKTTFPVIYHPRMCTSAFIVPYDTVMEALKVNYLPGMRFETLDGGDPEYGSNKFTGMITAKEDIDSARWPNSEWRCLKVQWTTSSSTHVYPRRVSPWDIQPLAFNMLSFDRKRSMPFEPMIRNNRFPRISGTFRSGGLQRRVLTRAETGKIWLKREKSGSSSLRNRKNLAEDEGRRAGIGARGSQDKFVM